MLAPSIIKSKTNFILCHTGVLYLASLERRDSQDYNANKDCWNLAKNFYEKNKLVRYAIPKNHYLALRQIVFLKSH
jgi:hypothetical protein